MQFLLGFVILIGCSYLGYGLSNYYVKRHRFILDLITFTNHLKVEIGFSKNNLQDIITLHIAEYQMGFKSVLKGYLKALTTSEYVTVENLKEHISTIYLDEPETNQMLQFFNFLGKSDAYNQVEIINKSLNIFNSFLKNSLLEKQKYSGMFKKLGVLTGVFIVLVTI